MLENIYFAQRIKEWHIFTIRTTKCDDTFISKSLTLKELIISNILFVFEHSIMTIVAVLVVGVVVIFVQML